MGQYAGKMVGFEQSVVNTYAGKMVGFEQEVVLRNSFAGKMVGFEQSVRNSFTGKMVGFEQSVVDSTAPSNVSKYGWDLHLMIGGLSIEPNLIHGNMTVTRGENNASLLTVTLINKTGALDLTEYHGKEIILNVETATGIRRIYTGIVDYPNFDLLNKLITLECTDRRTELINGQLADQLRFIGKWSDAVFKTPNDTAEELSNRLLTTTQTVDFDAYGNYTISDFLPKATPDFTLSDASIYRRRPSLSVASRGRLINRVNIDFEFRYVRLRHRERSFELAGPEFCDVMNVRGLAFLSVEGIKSNLDSFGWTVKASSVDYTFLPPAGIYDCGYGRFIWSPVAHNVITGNKKDADGNNITDSQGNPIVEVKSSSSTDYTEAFAIEVNWQASKQFAQDISHKIAIEINAPQSQSQYGVIENSMTNGLGVEFDTTEFEKNDEYTSPPADFTSTATDSYQDQYGSLSDYDNALKTVIAMAKTKIAKTHRDNQVELQVPLWPEIDLKHTVESTAGLIQCKGKVSRIQHTFNIGERFADTTIQLSMSRATGSQADGTLNIPIAAAPLVGDPFVTVLKMNTYKLDSGFNIGGPSNPIKELGLYTPPIDDLSRKKQTLEESYSLDVSIRNDLLNVVY